MVGFTQNFRERFPRPDTDEPSSSAIMLGDSFYFSLLPNGRDRNKEGFRVDGAVGVGITGRKHTHDMSFVVDGGTGISCH